jgi:hypothetical protein
MYASDASAPIQWRLLGGNNRELGRGTGEFVDQESCVLGIKHLKNVIADLEISLRRNDAGAWGWLLCLGGVSVATSGYRYDRQIRCRQGQAQFVDALESCEIGSGLTFTHSRRWPAAYRTVRSIHRDVP